MCDKERKLLVFNCQPYISSPKKKQGVNQKGIKNMLPLIHHLCFHATLKNPLKQTIQYLAFTKERKNLFNFTQRAFCKTNHFPYEL